MNTGGLLLFAMQFLIRRLRLYVLLNVSILQTGAVDRYEKGLVFFGSDRHISAAKILYVALD
jgi:hypothetical protein